MNITSKFSNAFWDLHFMFVQKYYLILFHKNNRFIFKGKLRHVKFDINGGGNLVQVKSFTIINNVTIKIRGNNNRVIIGERCYIGNGCSIWAEGNNITIQIGDECTFTHDDQICAQEDNSKVSIGKDCMFSHHINVRTSDSHLIYNTESNERINYPRAVNIGNHVWIAPNSIIMKGVTIGEGCIIGSNTIVTKNVPHCSLAVGMPAKVVRENVSWSREKLF